MELKVEEIKSLAPIQFNYEDIKKWVTEKAKEYKSVVYTEETITAAKTDRATLNKVAKAINDEKIRIKKEVLKPFEDFENKCKELQGIITDSRSRLFKWFINICSCNYRKEANMIHLVVKTSLCFI